MVVVAISCQSFTSAHDLRLTLRTKYVAGALLLFFTFVRPVFFVNEVHARCVRLAVGGAAYMLALLLWRLACDSLARLRCMYCWHHHCTVRVWDIVRRFSRPLLVFDFCCLYLSRFCTKLYNLRLEINDGLK